MSGSWTPATNDFTGRCAADLIGVIQMVTPLWVAPPGSVSVTVPVEPEV